MGEQDNPGSWTLGEEDFKKLMNGQQKTHQAIEQTSDRVEKIAEEQEEQGEQLDQLNDTVSGMSTNMTTMQANVGHLKERAAEDRNHVDSKETELEGKVGQVHDRLDKAERTSAKHRGEYDNHVKDKHATVALQTKTDLATHVGNNDRHGGTPPGSVKRTAAIAGGGLAGGGVLVVIVKMIIDAFAG